MELEQAIKFRLEYFYDLKVDNDPLLSQMVLELCRLAITYHKIYTSHWFGELITSLYLMTNSTVRVIILTDDKRLAVGRIMGDKVAVDKLECGLQDDFVSLYSAKAVILI